MAEHHPPAEPSRDLSSDGPNPIRDLLTADAVRDIPTTHHGVSDGSAAEGTINGFELLDEIGRGGMGVVYLATDEELGREVAVKVLARGLRGNPAVEARFVEEARITAGLQHPGIPPVYRVGRLSDGRPFLAMKLIRGRTLSALLREQGYGSTRWLPAFEGICQAVGYAHAAGYIHRDLKPGNVMVGAFGEVQVMDWGLAKQLAPRSPGVREVGGPGTGSATGPGSTSPAAADPSEADLTRPNLFAPTAPPRDGTRAGAVMGTPPYMAPEQARGEIDAVDRRSDVFSLGCILCQLLTGATPLSGAAGDIISAAAGGHFPEAFARLDGCGEDAALVGLAKRCLSGERADRPADATAVADAVAAYRGEADARAKRAEVAKAEATVQAAEGRKRQRQFRLAAGVIGVVLTLGIIGTGVGLLVALDRANKEERAKIEEREAKEREAEEKRQKEEQRLIAEGAKGLAEIRRRDAEDSNADLWNGLDTLTSNIVGETLATQQSVSAPQKAFLTTVRPLYQKLTTKSGNDQTSRERAAQAMYRVGLIEYRLGRKQESAAALEQARSGFEKLANDYPAADYEVTLADISFSLGNPLVDLGRLPDADGAYRQALKGYGRLADRFPAEPKYRHGQAVCHASLGGLLRRQGNVKEAEGEYRKGVELYSKLAEQFPHVPKYRADLAKTYTNYGGTLNDLGHSREAEGATRQGLKLFEALVEQFPDVPEYRYDLGDNHHSLGGYLADRNDGKGAEGEYRKAVAIHQQLAKQFPAVPDYRNDMAKGLTALGVTLHFQGGGQGVAECRQAVLLHEALVKDFPNDSRYRDYLASSYGSLGMVLIERGDAKGAEEAYRKSLSQFEQLAEQHPGRPAYTFGQANCHASLGGLSAERGDVKGAEAEFRKAAAIVRKLVEGGQALPVHRTHLARLHLILGDLVKDTGRLKAAAEDYDRGLVIWAKLSTEFPAVVEHRSNLASCHNRLGLLFDSLKRWEEAGRHFEKAIAVQVELVKEFPAAAEHPVGLGGSYCNLGNMLRDSGRPQDSLSWYQKGISTLSPVRERNPKNSAATQYLRNCFSGRAQSYEGLKKYAEAVQDWTRAIELSSKGDQPAYRAGRALCQLEAGRVSEAVAEVAELRKLNGWDADQQFDFARVYSVASGTIPEKKAEYGDAAVDLLRSAIKGGYQDVAALKADNGLDPLRGRDDFKKLVADLEKKFPPKRETLPPPRADK